MSTTAKQPNLTVLDLTQEILVKTTIPKENHAALRAGFIGCPANPRWNISKYQAWKTGRQWQQALKQGDMVVRKTDSLLVLANEGKIKQQDQLSQKSLKPKWLNLPLKGIQLANFSL